MIGVWPALLGAQTAPLPATLPEDLLPGLGEVLHGALQQSPQMISRNIDLASQEANRYQQAALQWPSLGGTAYYTENKSAVSNNPNSSTRNRGFFYNLNLNQPIYHWGALQAATDIAHLQIKISESQYADAYRQLAMTIRSQYLSLIVQKVQLRNARYAFQLAQAALATMEERFKNGSAMASDVSGFRSAMEEASLAADRATEDFRHSKRLLLLTAGLAALNDDNIPEEIPKPVYSADAAAAFMQRTAREDLSKTFQAQVYDDQVKQSALNYKIAKYRLYPKLDLQLGVSEQNQTQVVGNVVTQNPIFFTNVTVAANWSIFDGFATRGAKLAALASKRAAERNRQSYLDQTLEQARDLELQVGFAIRAMALAEERLASYERHLQETRDNLKLGVGSQADVDQAATNFYQVQAAAFGARVEFYARWSEYLSLLDADPVLNNLPARFISNVK